MSLLDGLAGIGVGLAGAGSAFAAREEAERLDRELAIREAQEARAVQERTVLLEQDNSNQNIRMAKNAGITNDGLDRIDRDRTVGKLEANDPVAREALLNIARTSGFIDPSVKDIRFVKGPNDEWVIQTSNEDGTFGVITADGSKDPNSPVASFKSLDDFLDVANVAYNRSVVRQTEFDIAKQNTVTQALNAQFDLLEKDLEEKGVPPEQQVAIKRGVASGVANIEDPQEKVAFVQTVINDGAPPAAAETPVPETPDPQEEPTAPRRGVRGPLEIMGETEQRGLAARKQKELPQKKSELEEAEARVTRLEESGTGGRALRAAQTRRDRLRDEIAELEPATFIMDTPEDQEAMNQVAEQTEGLPVSEVAAKVASGEVTVTPAQQQQVAVSLQQAGVETVSDLRNLKSDRQRALAVASMISAFKGDEATQRMLVAQVSNVLETGTTSMSAADAATLGVQQQNANLRAAEFERAVYNDRRDAVQLAATAGSEMLKEWGKIKEEEGDSFEAAMRFLNTQAAPFINEYRNKPKWLQKAYKDALNPVVSEILAAYAAQEEGGLAESFYSLFRDDIDRENVSKTDFDLNRVKGDFTIDEDGEVKIKGFWFTDQDGDEMDESVPAKVLLDLDKTLYDILLLAAVSNRTSGGED